MAFLYAFPEPERDDGLARSKIHHGSLAIGYLYLDDVQVRTSQGHTLHLLGFAAKDPDLSFLYGTSCTRGYSTSSPAFLRTTFEYTNNVCDEITMVCVKA